ncbi:hypothetical protein PMPD1_1599 [Paramixta manurensis]|uniref:Uncharacterized protein n=1 Tax=Paramixta manurensis TaxID=2740817 RepID=A0A6M8UFP8_9GAMM|nr:hypothetical protein PMPD1_1599 [Erwiniaceae bacterium PD-1]
MMKIIKFIFLSLFFDVIPVWIVIILSALYVEFIPEHWGKLTLLTIAVVVWKGDCFDPIKK